MKILVLILLVSVTSQAQTYVGWNAANAVARRDQFGLLPSIPHPHYDVTLESHGDSISRDQQSQNYIFQVWTNIAALGLYPHVHQRGINGISWNYRWTGEPYTATMIQDAPWLVDPMYEGGKTNWLVLFAGTNGIGIGLHSAATEYSDFQTYLLARLSAGWTPNNIVVMTMLPRAGVSNTTRATYNADLVAGATTYGYRLARVDLDPNIGCNGCDTNLTYFYDGTHPTVAGHTIIAGIVYSAMYP